LYGCYLLCYAIRGFYGPFFFVTIKKKEGEKKIKDRRMFHEQLHF
jgi:hypothetical protein